MNGCPGLKRGCRGCVGNVLNRCRGERRGQASSSAVAIVSVMPFRNGSVLEAGRVNSILYADPPSDVNSPILKNPAKARQKEACSVALSNVF